MISTQKIVKVFEQTSLVSANSVATLPLETSRIHQFVSANNPVDSSCSPQLSLDQMMLQLDLTLEQLHLISKEQWMNAIKTHPHEAVLYYNLAKRLDFEETAEIDSTSFTFKSLFLKAIELNGDKACIYRAFAEKTYHFYFFLFDHRSGLSFPNTTKLLPEIYEELKTLYGQAISYNPTDPAPYIQAAEFLKTKDALYIHDKQLSVTSIQLCLQAIEQDPLYSDSYRHLADLTKDKKRSLTFLPGYCLKDLYLKSIELAPDNISNYVSIPGMG